MNPMPSRPDIQRRYAEYLQPARKPGTYVCPLCGNGTGATGDGLALNPHTDGFHLKCFHCGFYGDILQLYQQEHGCTFPAAYRDLCRLLHLPEDAATSEAKPDVSGARKTGAFFLQENPQKTTPENPDYRAYFTQAEARLTASPEAVDYLTRRGIRLETARQFHLGYDPDWISPTALRRQAASENPRPIARSPRLIIPTSNRSYVARDIRPNAPAKYAKMKEGTSELFHTDVLDNEENQTVLFVTEGEIDALSIAEAGSHALALGSTSNVPKFLSLLQVRLSGKPERPVFVLCLDNDAPGRNASQKLERALKHMHIPCIDGSPVIYGSEYQSQQPLFKDPNEFLQTDRIAFIKTIQRVEQAMKPKPDNMHDYMTRFLKEEIHHFTENLNRKTGFYNLDARTEGIYPGLYVLGAISSLGKTTFIHQMADQMAAAGEHVLFFSLEQSRLELASKSLARLTARKDFNHACTSLDIRSGIWTPLVSEALQTYLETIADRLSIVEGNLNCGISFLSDYISRYRRKNGVRPVVILDYLQILQGNAGPTHSIRESVDTNVTELKRLSRTHNIPVFLVSSLNRNSYLTPIAFESFKESGGIEYTADVVWGLQLTVMEEDLFHRDGLFPRKRERIQAAKRADPRNVDLVCLKNRYGISDYKVSFHYYPKYDLFIPYQPNDWGLAHSPPDPPRQI